MTTKNYTFLTILFTVVFLIKGCTTDFEEINTNPNQSNQGPSLDLLFGAIVPGFIGQNINSYQVPGQFVQQFAVKNSEEGALTQDDDAISRRTWEIFYSENGGALRNVELLKFEAENQGHQTYKAIANILKTYMLSQLTDLFGDIPYKDAGQGFKLEDRYLFPIYDSQQEIYDTMLADLENANSVLANSPATEIIDANRDLLFSGNKLAWRKFANSLRLRFLLRISEATNVSARVADIFNNSTNNPVFTSISDEPSFSYNSINNWPFDNSNPVIDEIRISETVVEIMKGNGGVNSVSTLQDPRLSWLLSPTANSITTGTPEFVGQPVGIASDITESDDRSLLSDNFKNLNTFWLLTFAEVNFIKAEAAFRGIISGNATDYYKAGINASLQRYGIDVSTATSTAYINDAVVNFASNQIKHIAIQRWLDQVNNGFEGYAVWRRMNFPTLSLGPDVVATQIPTRYFYSSKTTDKNQANADAAINRAPLNGNNTPLAKVWWDVN
ncbi:SusD/RagB family nutrient-binding outer membrane lipoprotein [Tenacibaculum agarivorans]|uniref:SusD/RagB family nutrient-binding outer membrane lipoprotein n=1 Tax=Tenacibaculum agarivorans TaxID=1908389 RepID=UPI00094BC219|nr:SusD/RagB family nutrient-binding outer membrane lipoprotein [Tenacibaculum agarivorans]